MTVILYCTFEIIFHQTTHHREQSFKTKQINSFKISLRKRINIHLQKPTINKRKKTTSQKKRSLTMNVARKKKQDVLTTTTVRHCPIVCETQECIKQACVPQTSATENHLFKMKAGDTEQERKTLMGDDRVRGLCLLRAAGTPRSGSWACPPAHLGGYVVGQEAKNEAPQGLSEASHVIGDSSMTPLKKTKTVDSNRVNQILNSWMLEAALGKILPKNTPPLIKP